MSLADEFPEAASLIANMKLDNETVSAMTYAVAVEGQDPAEFAKAWVAENGYAMVSSYQRYKTNRNHIVADREQADRLIAQLAEPARGAA